MSSLQPEATLRKRGFMDDIMAMTVVTRRAINLMSLTIAIACADRIVVASDGLIIDDKSKDPKDSTKKIFPLSSKVLALVTGEKLGNHLNSYMEGLATYLGAENFTNTTNAAIAVKKCIDKRGWADEEFKDDHKGCHMELIIAGYDDSVPKVHLLLSNRESEYGVTAHAFIPVPECMSYFRGCISPAYSENTFKQANKTCVEMLSRAAAALPNEVGEPYAISHIFPSRVYRLRPTDIEKLLKRYG